MSNIECCICYDERGLWKTDCIVPHYICIPCIIKSNLDRCPYCRKKLNFPYDIKDIQKKYNNYIEDYDFENITRQSKWLCISNFIASLIVILTIFYLYYTGFHIKCKLIL